MPASMGKSVSRHTSGELRPLTTPARLRCLKCRLLRGEEWRMEVRLKDLVDGCRLLRDGGWRLDKVEK